MTMPTQPGATESSMVTKKPAQPAKAASPALTERAARKRLSKAQKATLAIRKQLWPDVTDAQLWLRKDRDGFTTIPRTMPLFMELIADVSKRVTAGKSVPAGKAYLVLWCRVFDEALVKIESDATAAMEAGYIGERNVTTWREHLRVLKALEFIDYREGRTGPSQFVLLLNPYYAVKRLHEKKWVQDRTYIALFERAQEIGATELNDMEDDD